MNKKYVLYGAVVLFILIWFNLGSRVLEIDKKISNIRLWLRKTHIKNEQN